MSDPRSVARMHLAQALTRCANADAREHVRAALDALDDGGARESAGYDLDECPVCGAVGLEETIDGHDCSANRRRQHRRQRRRWH